MADRVLDLSGLKFPYSILKLSSLYPHFKEGETVEVIGDCSTFEKDISVWCHSLGKTILSTVKEGSKIKVTIRI